MNIEEMYVGQIVSYECERYKILSINEKDNSIVAVKYTYDNPRYTFNKQDINNMIVAKIESNYIS